MDAARIDAWRSEERRTLIAARESIAADEAASIRDRVTAHLAALLHLPVPGVLGFCWPHRGEIDPRFAVRIARNRGVVAALPVVVGKGRPLEFRLWWPGAPMRRGALGIPHPEGTAAVVPDVLLIPLVAFDARGYRLGYGGGYFDRTLAAIEPRPIAIGLAAARFRLATVHPQPHDLPMDFVVTEDGTDAAGEAGLAPIDDAAAAAHMQTCLASRRLPRERCRSTPAGYSSPVCYASEFPGWFGETDDDAPAGA